jgi:polygalacturonase
MTEQEIKSIKDFGAVGDGITDDTNAVQAAFDWAAENQKKLAPAGPDNTFRVTRPIKIK